MKHFKASGLPRLASLFAGAALLGLVSQSAMAAGTLSGTAVNNLAKLSYSVGGTDQDEICSSDVGNSLGNGGTTGTTCTSGTNGAVNTTFTVDNRVNLTVAEIGTAVTTVVPGSLAQVTTFTVTNNGNTVQDYALVAANVASLEILFGVTDNFQADNVLLFVESGVTPGYQVGQDTATHIDELGADLSEIVYVVVDIPVTRVNGDAALVSLTATTHDGGTAGGAIGALTDNDSGIANTAGVDVVWADAAGSDDAATDGAHSARDAYSVGSAVLTVTKASTLLCDPFNGDTNPKMIPGAVVQYAVTISNAIGATSATLASVVDALQADLTFNTDLISGVGVAANCVTGTGSLSASGFGAVSGTGATATTYVAPGLAGDATTAGATVAGQDVTVDYTTLVSPNYGLVGAVLPANAFVTVYFNVIVN